MVFAELPHVGARLGRGGHGPGFPAPGLKGPFLCLTRPTSPTPPNSALLIALVPALPHAFMKVLLVLSLGFFQCGADGVRSVCTREK